MRKFYRLTSTKLLFLLVLLLSLVGLVFVFESSVSEAFTTFNDPYHFLSQHSIGLAIGLILFLVAVILPSKFWLKLSPLLMVITLISLVAVFIPGVGLKLNGARRWLSVGPLTLQPVEFAKLALISYLSIWLSKQQKLAPFLILVGIPTLLIALQPDLGSLLVFLAIGFGMYFISGGRLKHLFYTLVTGVISVVGLIALSPYRRDRVLTYLNPETDPLGRSFHIRQIMLAIGRGGWFGQGIGNSAQKYAYIPEVSTDSIFAVIGEEVGFVGSMFLMSAYLVFLLLIYRVAKRQKSKEKKLLAYGIFFWIAVQAVLNLMAVVGLIPLTGVTLPFFSYGRSSQVMLLLATGIIVRLGREK